MSKPEKAKQKESEQSWFEFFSSTRLAIYLLITITIACFAGTLLPQKGVTLNPGDYEALIQSPLWNAMDRLGFLSVFSSIWFLVLIALITTNLVFCSIKGIGRVGNKFRAARRPITMNGARARSTHWLFKSSKANTETVKEALSDLGQVKVFEQDGKTQFRVEKGRLSLFTPYLVHLSIIILIIGSMVDVLLGVDGQMNIAERTSSNVFTIFSNSGEVEKFEMPFAIRCDDFELELYPGTNRPKDYKSILTVLDNGEAVLEKTIEVNDPLEYKGIRFFQSSYGQVGATTTIKVIRKADGAEQIVSTVPGETKKVKEFKEDLKDSKDPNKVLSPGLTGFSILDYNPDFQNLGPAVHMAVLRTDGQSDPFMLFQNSPDFDDQRKGSYKFVFEGIDTTYYTGLMVVSKPGVWLIWIGSTLFMLAICWGFLVPHRRAWALLDNETVAFIGASNRSKENWEKRLHTAADRLQSSLGTPKEKPKP